MVRTRPAALVHRCACQQSVTEGVPKRHRARGNGLQGCSLSVFLTVALRAPPPGRGPPTLRGVDEALAELAAYFRRRCDEDRLDRQDARQLHHFIEVGEYGLALEEIAGALAQAKAPIADQERSDMLALTATMKMDDLVPRALGFCPRAG